jgi:hypothetical protein
MLHVFSTNRVKLVARKSETTDKQEEREQALFYCATSVVFFSKPNMFFLSQYFSASTSISQILAKRTGQMKLYQVPQTALQLYTIALVVQSTY